jgi:hypothetical protein
MTASTIIARHAPSPSSPAQVRAAERLWGSDGAGTAEHKLLPFHQYRINRITEQTRRD